MKKTITFLILCVLTTTVMAQSFQVSTGTFDLEKVNRHKGWRNYGGYVNDQGQYVVKLGQAVCDASSSVSGSIDRTIAASFKGVAYNFEEFIFNPDFSFAKTEVKKFGTSAEALKYQPGIYGKKFGVTPGIMTGSTTMTGAFKDVAAALKEGSATMSSNYTPDFMKTIVVVPGQKGNKPMVRSVAILTQVRGSINTSKYTTNYTLSCSEIPAYYVIEDKMLKEEKGQFWQAHCNVEYPGGGAVGFFTSGVLPKDGKQNMIFRRYDDALNEAASQNIVFDYKAKTKMFRVVNADGSSDFVVYAVSTNSKQPYKNEITTEKPADFAEILYLNGQTLAIEKRIPLTLPLSDWEPVDMHQDEKGNIYLGGKAGTNNKTYTLGFGATFVATNPKKRPNYQILSFTKDKINWINGIDAAKEKKKIVKVKGIKKGNSTKVAEIMNEGNTGSTMFFNNYMVLSNKKVGGHVYVALINRNTGNLENYLVRPESHPGKWDVMPGKDGKTLYWASYDFKKYNKYDKKSGVITAKKIDAMIAGELYLTKFSVDNPGTPVFELLGEKQYVVSWDDALVTGELPNEDMVFQGRSLARKAKNSELTLIGVKK